MKPVGAVVRSAVMSCLAVNILVRDRAMRDFVVHVRRSYRQLAIVER
jgi:hypothetical protein